MEIRNLHFRYDDKKILNGLDISFEKGKITTLLGANGSGKSTLFKICTRNLRQQSGIVMLDEKNIFYMNNKEFAKKVAIVHQHNRITGDITVKQLVTYGRTPYLKFMKKIDTQDEEAINWALKETDLENIKHNEVNKLSGGQKQRVFIAMALAQMSEIIFLDEPTTYLDIKYQIDLLELIKRLNEQYSKTIVMVLHDINQAIRYSDKLIGLKNGNIIFNDTPKKCINEKNISDLYGINLNIKEINNIPYVLI